MFDWLNSKLKLLKRYHMSMLKLSVAGFILMIAKLRDGILYLDWYRYLVFGTVFALPLLWKMFGKCEMKK